ncbi:late sexual development protein [Stachybotrys elegans]|uniref:Late sexual development protein n=1 Tax=Stachybotrys elegans TaxID=80388 RepID=A0A8K0SI51_9HYPO|nr:late sexual development protein [Stachybotrys elegans]
MSLSKFIGLATAFSGIASGLVVPRSFSVPRNDSFPSPNNEQKKLIAEQAGGLLPNSPLPSSLDAASTTTLQLIAFNELFETAYFNSLLQNATNHSPGYEQADDRLIDTIRAQEESHALGAITALRTAGAFTPSPCEYVFPVTSLPDAVFFAETFTAVVLGSLQGANVNFAKGGFAGLVQLISSVIGQEGEQNGYYRDFLDRIPSESPFLTYVPAAFAWSVLQTVVVPGSCPYSLDEIALPVFQPLYANNGPIALLQPEDQTITFSADLANITNASQYIETTADLFLTYTTGQQLPFSVPIANTQWDGSRITFDASFPYSEYVMHGFSHAALTTNETYSSAEAVADSTLVGPALLQVNNSI